MIKSEDVIESKVKQIVGPEDKVEALPRPKIGTLIMCSGDAEWEIDGSTGFSYKNLFKDLNTGQSTMLMKVNAGALALPHAHEELEQVFILEGEFYDEYRSYEVGDFIVRAPGVVHTGGSKTGALLFVVYSK